MLPEFLLPETTVREAGKGLVISVPRERSGKLLLTLGITRIIEHEGIDISVWGSPDGQDWGVRPLVSFPQKFYCGTYQIQLDLANRPDVRYLRAQWQVTRWAGKGGPLFTVYLFMQAMDRHLVAAGA
jgi:hypothetical protein